LGLPPTARLDTCLCYVQNLAPLSIAMCVLLVSKLYAGHYP
jgi:hypothetical protein